MSHLPIKNLTQMGKGGQSPGQILQELGLRGVWGGLGTRVIMIGTLTGKSHVGVPLYPSFCLLSSCFVFFLVAKNVESPFIRVWKVRESSDPRYFILSYPPTV